MNKTERLESMKAELEAIRTKFETEINKKYELSRKESAIADQIKIIESDIKETINSARTDEGKAVYSNMEAREIASFKALQNTPKYNEFKDKQKLVFYELDENKKSIEIIGKDLKIIEMILKIEEMI